MKNIKKKLFSSFSSKSYKKIRKFQNNKPRIKVLKNKNKIKCLLNKNIIYFLIILLLCIFSLVLLYILLSKNKFYDIVIVLTVWRRNNIERQLIQVKNQSILKNKKTHIQ